MTRRLTAAALQFAPTSSMQENIDQVVELTREAARQGANLIVPPELFCGPYFCAHQDEVEFSRAHAWQTHPAVLQLSKLAAELGIVIPVSIFEKSGPEYFNSLVMLDADGVALGVYRKSHIPDGPGYQEKFYFRPGNTGFRVWKTQHGNIGAGICWDQWFPECARAMVLQGADILVYPTAIGSEPQDAMLDTAARWRRAMQGHAVSNVIPIVAANRVGTESGQSFYGTSFIANEEGEVVADMDRHDTGIIMAVFDLEEIDRQRAAWGFFRDRRTDLYATLLDQGRASES